MLSRALRQLASSSSTNGKLFPYRSFALRTLHGAESRAWEENKEEELVGGSEHGSVTIVHPTAVVHPRATLGRGVSVGPFCTVGCDSKIGDACQLHPGSHVFGDTELGDHSILLAGAIVGADIPGRTIIGSNNIIGHHAVVGVKCQDMKYKSGDECFLHVGNNNDIREHVSIHRSSTSTNKTDHSHTAGAAVVHQFCHLGSFCFIGGGSVVF